MFLLYAFIIRLYHSIIRLAAIFHPKAKLLVEGRNHQLSTFIEIGKLWADQHIVMIHAASYGEYEMAKPIVEQLLAQENIRILVSFHSPSGYEHTQFEDERIKKIYLPIDLLKSQEAFINAINPQRVVFIKYEFWFNLLRVLNSKNIPYYYTSLHLNQDSYLFRKYMHSFLDLIKKSKVIYCHNPESESILISNGFSNTRIIGDTRIQQAKANIEKYHINVDWTNKAPVIAFGSIIDSEYPLLTQVLTEFPEANFLIAPHDIEEEDMAQLKSLTGPDTKLYSTLKGVTPAATLSKRCLIVNTLGDLRYLYRSADICYVGAGFDKGPHNVIEPLIYGIPTICGPNIKKFPMAQHLSKVNLLTVIDTFDQLPKALSEGLSIDRSVFKKQVIEELDSLEANIEELVKELSPN